MKNQFLNCLFTLLASALFSQFSFGQDTETRQKIDNWFLEQRFIMADQNDDAMLDRKEMENFEEEFVYFLTSRYFDLSDTNRDGLLNFGEMFARRKSEYLFRYNFERKQLRRLMQSYPALPQADISYLKKNPALVSALFNNLVWMYEKAELVEKLLKDGFWIENHPEVMLSLHNNIRWMAANPDRARRLYQNRSFTQQLPQFIGWRAGHKRFIKSNSLVDRFYETSFIPAGIHIQR